MADRSNSIRQNKLTLTHTQLLTPNFEGALSFFVRAAELFAQTYDGKDEVCVCMCMCVCVWLVAVRYKIAFHSPTPPTKPPLTD